MAPTRLYGYVTSGRDAEPEDERSYIVAAKVERGPLLGTVPVPLSTKNFVNFGVSSTPTLVLVDRGGTVRLYHPGKIEESELAEHIESLL